jgi:hypothetical protein
VGVQGQSLERLGVLRSRHPSGYASVFCHEGTKDTTTTVKLKGLDPEKQYHITDFDGLVDVTADGKTLMEQGITVTVPEKPYAVLLLIKPAA